MSDRFDYIVVGGGTAGCVVARRLSDQSGTRVLLIEAGGRRQPFSSRVPLMFHTLKRHRKADWAYLSEPEPGAAHRRFLRSHGKGLGGSSAINGMIAVRGHPKDYDDWAELGLTGWSYADVLPYFRRSETHWRGVNAEHGGDGPWKIGPGYRDDFLYRVLTETARAAGRPVIEDFAGHHLEGLGAPDFSIDAGERVSTATAYLREAGTNLNLMTDAQVVRVLIERSKAVGVEILRDGAVSRVHAEGEVILSAGAYNSAQILLLSGVGDAAALKDVGVMPVHPLPGVGQNLQGHVSVPLQYRARCRQGFHGELRMDRLALSALRWAVTRKGAFARVPLSALSLVRSRDGLDRPDIQIMHSTARMGDRPWFPGVLPGSGHFISCSLSLCRPRSRGAVTLRSRSPLDPPRIRFNLLDDPDDIVRLRDAIRGERRFHRMPPLAGLLGDEDLPGDGYQSDEELQARLRETATSAQHPTSTCAMGVGPDAVTDAELKVRGIDALRVADASVMPLIVSGNTYATAVMIGEKAADLILGRKAA